VDFSGHPTFPASDVNEVVKGHKVVYATREHTAKADDVLAEILTAMGFPVVR
jgi:hypothetical protein